LTMNLSREYRSSRVPRVLVLVMTSSAFRRDGQEDVVVRPFGSAAGVVAGGEVCGQRTPVPVPGVQGAQRAVADRAARVLDGPLGGAGALAGAYQDEADPGIPNDFGQPGGLASGMLNKPFEQVLSPPAVVPGMLVGLAEVEQVADAKLTGHGWASR